MKIFWDTNLFIYLWENSANTERVVRLAANLESRSARLCTSSLTIAEILVHPMRSGDDTLVANYLDRFSLIEIISFGVPEAMNFARVRARFAGVAPPDAMQVACAESAGVDLFVTNDSRLERLELPSIGTIASLDRALELF